MIPDDAELEVALEPLVPQGQDPRDHDRCAAERRYSAQAMEDRIRACGGPIEPEELYEEIEVAA